jgi:hypothetical protein
MSGDSDAVPGVDEDDSHDDLGEVLRIEQAGGLLVGGVGDMIADEGHFFGEGEDSTFFRRKIAGIAPGVEGIDALLRLACCAGIAGVHVDTEGAAVDLGGADLDKLLVDGRKPGCLDIVGKTIKYFIGGGFGLIDFDSCAHDWMFFTGTKFGRAAG